MTGIFETWLCLKQHYNRPKNNVWLKGSQEIAANVTPPRVLQSLDKAFVLEVVREVRQPHVLPPLT